MGLFAEHGGRDIPICSMAASGEVFNRHELKYLITHAQKEKFLEMIADHVVMDKFGDNDGHYRIVSLYFDSDDKKIYYETRNNLPFRQKLRLRTYDSFKETATAFLELKQKFINVVNKRRTIIDFDEACAYLNNTKDLSEIESSNTQILKEIDSFKKLYNLKPATAIKYDRQAFEGKDNKDLRITFDYNLVCAPSRGLGQKFGAETNFIDPDKVVLEVKTSHAVPLWLARVLSELEFFRHKVSKYCLGTEQLEAFGLGESLESSESDESPDSSFKLSEKKWNP